MSNAPNEPDIETPEADPAPEPIPQQPVIAVASGYYRNMRFIFVAAIVLMGGWFLKDGFVGYPEHNRKYDEITARQTAAENDEERAAIASELKKLGDKHSDMDILTQQILGFLLPPLGLALLGFFLHRSRGEYKVENDTLYAPGHPPVPFGAITGIDNSFWEKKGIARVTYRVDAQEGAIVLDDFIYQRKPIDDIKLVLDDAMMKASQGK